MQHHEGTLKFAEPSEFNEIKFDTVLPALRANSCIAIDRLMIELLDFHIPFLSFTNAGFKGYGKNLLNRRLRITQLP